MKTLDQPPTTKPRCLVVGATGATGRLILRRAQQQGLPTRALARNPETLRNEASSGIEVIAGDVLDSSTLASAVQDVDVVVSALGTPLILGKVTLLSEGTRHLVEVMQRARIPRFICITGMGAGDSRGHGGFLYDRLILPTLLRNVYADKNRQEHIVRASSLDWLIVRPARLTDSKARSQFREITQFTGLRMSTIARDDVAAFIVGQIIAPTYSRQSVNLSD